MIIRLAFPIVLALGLVNCGGSEPPSSAPPSTGTPATNTHPTAKEVAIALKRAAVPFLDELGGAPLPVSDIDVGKTHPVAAGILSDATTATEVASVSITVFTTREKLEQARGRVQKVNEQIHDTSYFADFGCTEVMLSPDTTVTASQRTTVAQAKQIQAVLNDTMTPRCPDR